MISFLKNKLFLTTVTAVILCVTFSLPTHAVTYSLEEMPEGLNLQWLASSSSQPNLYMNPYKIGGIVCNPIVVGASIRANGTSPCTAIQNYNSGFRWGYSISKPNENSTNKNNQMIFYYTLTPGTSFSNALNVENRLNDNIGVGVVGNLNNIGVITITISPTEESNVVVKSDSADGDFYYNIFLNNKENFNKILAGQVFGGALFYPIMSNFVINYPQDYTGYKIPQSISNSEVSDAQKIIDNLNNDDPDNVNSSVIGSATGWLPPGPLDSLLTLPIRWLNLFVGYTDTCSPPTFPLPYSNETISPPCFKQDNLTQIGFRATYEAFGVIAGGILGYFYFNWLFKTVNRIIFMIGKTDFQTWWGGL